MTQPKSAYRAGDRVRLIHRYAYRGNENVQNRPREGTEGTVQAIDQFQRDSSLLAVVWDTGHAKWTDIDRIAPVQPTKDELAEVYQILGATPRPHCRTCTCEEEPARRGRL